MNRSSPNKGHFRGTVDVIGFIVIAAMALEITSNQRREKSALENDPAVTNPIPVQNNPHMNLKK